MMLYPHLLLIDQMDSVADDSIFLVHEFRNIWDYHNLSLVTTNEYGIWKMASKMCLWSSNQSKKMGSKNINVI